MPQSLEVEKGKEELDRVWDLLTTMVKHNNSADTKSFRHFVMSNIDAVMTNEKLFDAFIECEQVIFLERDYLDDKNYYDTLLPYLKSIVVGEEVSMGFKASLRCSLLVHGIEDYASPEEKTSARYL
jgi:hypothetical protein